MTIQTHLSEQFVIQEGAFHRPLLKHPGLRQLRQQWRRLFYQPLNRAYRQAPRLFFDDRTKWVLFSDAHRGDGGRSDAFAPNKSLFLTALDYYLAAGHAVVEVGDGDELWKNRTLGQILDAHADVYDRFHALAHQNLLQFITGNHDTRDPARLRFHKDGLLTQEAVVLVHQPSGQEIFVVHGHQADLNSSWLHHVSQFLVERLLRQGQKWGVVPTKERPSILKRPLPGQSTSVLWEMVRPSAIRVENRLIDWAAEKQQLMVCGHTHAPLFSTGRHLRYFNSGACLFDNYMTAIEIEEGQLQMVRWKTDMTGAATAVHEPLSAPLSLSTFV